MILSEETLEALKPYLTKTIQKSSEADPEVLANYIIALLKDDKPRVELQSSLISSLEDFFKEETSQVVSTLFGVLREDSSGNVTFHELPKYDDDMNESIGSNHSDGEERDRRHVKREEEDEDNSQHSQSNYSREDYRDERRKRGRNGDFRDDRYNYDDRNRRGRRGRDERDNYDGSRRGGRRAQPSRQKCRDYEEKGYCRLGENCSFDHGSDRIVVDEQNMEQSEEYDPEKPQLEGNREDFRRGDDRSQRGGFNGKKRGRGDRFPPSKRARTRDGKGDKPEDEDNPDNHTIVCTEVPPELNSIERLNSHFGKFGPVKAIVPHFKSRAYITFLNHADAIKALESPEAVLGNRFIKIFWARKQTDVNKPIPPPLHQNSQLHNVNQSTVASVVVPSSPMKNQYVVPAQPPKPGMNLTTKKIEAPEVLAAKAQAKSEKEKETQKLKDEMRKHQLEQTKQLLEQMTKVKDPALKAELLNKLNSLTSNVADSLAKDSHNLKEKESQAVKKSAPPSRPPVVQYSNQTTSSPMQITNNNNNSTVTSEKQPSEELIKLQKRLDSLNAIAAGMGIVPGENQPAAIAPQYPMAGSFRAMRGGARGRGGAAVPMKLDNRPTTLKIESIPAEITGNFLEDHLKNFGEISNFSLVGDTATIQFKTRRGAEIAFSKGKSFGNHALNIKWAPQAKPKEEKEQPMEDAI